MTSLAALLSTPLVSPDITFAESPHQNMDHSCKLSNSNIPSRPVPRFLPPGSLILIRPSGRQTLVARGAQFGKLIQFEPIPPGHGGVTRSPRPLIETLITTFMSVHLGTAGTEVRRIQHCRIGSVHSFGFLRRLAPPT